jgi:hypothetical protein
MGHFKKRNDRHMNLKNILLFFLIFPTISVGQNTNIEIDSIFNLNSIDMSRRPVYRFAETMPTLKNGTSVLTYFLKKSNMFSDYITIADKVYISFIVEPDSTISNKKVFVKSVFDKYDGFITTGSKVKRMQELIEDNLSILPKMIPGKINNKDVAVQVILPIYCDINSYDEEIMKPLREYRNYDFVVKIDVQGYESDNNYKYLINLKWENDNNGNLIFYHDKLLQRVNFENNYDTNNYVEKRLAKDTLQYLLNESQLDSIYTLTAKIFQIDTINLSKDTAGVYPIYDGYFTDIELQNFFDVSYKARISGISNMKTLYNYHNLLRYLKSLEIDRVFFPAEDHRKGLIEDKQ